MRPEGTTAAWADIRRRYRPDAAVPAGLKELPFGRIEQVPEVFSVRRVNFDRRAHVGTLAARVKEGRRLAAVLVWPLGDGFVCIDGHCRLEAYAKAGVKAGTRVPVRVFEGTPDDAAFAAVQINSPARLQMSAMERSDAAWRLVILTGLTRQRIAEASGVSRRTVTTMRAVRDALAKMEGIDLAGLDWMSARHKAEGREEGEWDADEAERLRDAEAQEAAEAVRRVLNPKTMADPDRLRRMLDHLCPRTFHRAIYMHWEENPEMRPLVEECDEF